MARRRIPAQANYIGKFIEGRMAELGIKSAHLAEQLGKSTGMVSRYLSGDYPIPTDVFIDLLNLIDVVDEQHQAQLVKFNRDARNFGWVQEYGDFVGSIINIAKLEDDAHFHQVLELDVTPGVLQTEETAGALMRSGPMRHDPVAIEKQLKVRMGRKQVHTKENPPVCHYLLHESILRQRVGGPEVAAGQLRELLEVGELPNIDIRILPETGWSHIAAGIVTGSTLYHLPEPLPVVMYTDCSNKVLFRQDPDIDWFKDTFDALWADEALPPGKSAARIAKELKDVTA